MAEKKKSTEKSTVKTPARVPGPMEEVDINVVSEGQDVGFFATEGTTYANLPKSDEPITGHPYDPTVRNNTMNDDGSYEPSKAV